MSTLKIGDRVAAYEYGGRHTGEVVAWHGDNSVVRVKLDDPGEGPHDTRAFHPKQCRKLVKKERRRLKLPASFVEDMVKIWGAGTEDKGSVEFIEVRRKK